ncbi:sialate O-acetylesterase [Ruminococcus sp. YE71]|uniref:sialate O-acetylesterase n=1 Tax=unclassified Ruminococcus TaxID=2608920 RepID=UPI00088C972E|nr:MULTISPECIES: sialate O-acetylesterase [unclassified Ruminococcus]SDA10256.1 sialate O-acetylesterase [Ruminococcus sp. YE78]SFW10901.1 sialate O-acetylesterase [Ruminococcus sp. YE71]
MFTIASIFSSNMVLQREKCITVWGEADDGAVITAEINGSRGEGTAHGGKWSLSLPPMPAGGPYELTVSCGSESKTFTNVMLGEVWLCGGQSNMELELRNCKGGSEVLKDLTPDCNVRFYYTNKRGIIDEDFYEAERNSAWSEAGSESSKAWSAVGFFFARKLAKELGVTVGLVGCNWGGTSASAWVDRETLADSKQTVSYLEDYDKAIEGKSVEQQIAEYDAYAERMRQWNEKASVYYAEKPGITWDELAVLIGKNEYPGPMGCKNEYRPCGLYETMIMRVCPYTLRGFLYYQGESDDHKPDSYYKLFTALIARWREIWGDDELPFIMVQLPMFKYEADPDHRHWCKIREAQMKAFRTVKNTGIAVISDCGEFNNIHPVDKVPVGERLCLQAEKLVYGMDVDAFGPMFRSVVFEGENAKLSFDHAESGFEVKTEKVIGFEIAGDDKEFTEAEAEINGSNIIVHSEKVKTPKYVRYDWYNWIEVSLFGKNGIPLAPFTTER